MWLAYLSYARPGHPPPFAWQKVGKLWHDPATKNLAVMYNGFRIGPACGTATVEDAPFIDGDLMCRLGTATDGPVPTIDYQWCGWITTGEDRHGRVLYTAILEVIPAVNIEPGRGGLFLSVFQREKQLLTKSLDEVNAELEAAAEDDRKAAKEMIV